MRCAALATATTRGEGAASTQVEHLAGEREVPEVVRPELQLEAVLGAAQRRRHDAGVVDEHVDVVEALVQPVGAALDGGEAREVERDRLDRARRRRPGGSAARPASALSALRHARTTVAPARASSRAVISPMPLVAPVTTTMRPSWSGMSWAVHGSCTHTRTRSVRHDSRVRDYVFRFDVS